MIDMPEHSTAKHTSLPHFRLKGEDSSCLIRNTHFLNYTDNTVHGGNSLYPVEARGPAAFLFISSCPDYPDIPLHFVETGTVKGRKLSLLTVSLSVLIQCGSPSVSVHSPILIFL